jgi:hypothetical protein
VLQIEVPNIEQDRRRQMAIMSRKRVLFTFATGLAVLGMASTAFACVTFKGQMTVDGHDGSTWVEGTGNSHGYCSTGVPTSAAAGHLTDTIDVTVAPGTCADDGAEPEHMMENGTYLVKYNNKKSYNLVSGTWEMVSNTGCFWSGNSATVSDGDPSTFQVGGPGTGGDGHGTWSGTLGTLSGTPYYPSSTEAANFCVGAENSDSSGRTGLLAPFRLLEI